jgi:hypothetical protein
MEMSETGYIYNVLVNDKEKVCANIIAESYIYTGKENDLSSVSLAVRKIISDILDHFEISSKSSI